MKNVIMKNKWKFITSSLSILLPVIIGWFLQEKDIVYGFLYLFLHWVILIVIFHDRRNKVQSRKVIDLIFWIVPICSIFSALVFHAVRQGQNSGTMLMLILYVGLGMLFVIIGNYLPKIQQNSTVGIKVKWALRDEKNWNATHRFSGKIWVAGGLLCMICGMLPETPLAAILFVTIIMLIGFLPILYSYIFYRKQVKEGKTEKNTFNQRSAVIGFFITLGIVLFFAWTLLSGNMAIEYNSTSFTIKTEKWKDLTISYREIENIEYQPNNASQKASEIRTNGFGNIRMSLGSYKNDRYGDYTRYTYANCTSRVVLTVKGEIVVINGPDDAATKRIYEVLNEKMQISS